MPAGHVVHDDAPPTAEKVPGEHDLHVVAAVAPGLSEKVPAGHCVHDVARLAEKVPA